MAKKKRFEKLGEEAKSRSDYFQEYLGKRLILTGKILAIRDVLSTNFIGKSVLFGELNIPNVDHIWIHLNEFLNLEGIPQEEITIIGTVYSYTREYRGKKIWHTKYSLKDVEVLSDEICS